MATPTLSLATMGSTKKKQSNKNVQNEVKTKDSILSSTPKLVLNDKKLRKFWGEEVSDDSIYSIYLKKITYSFNCDEMNSKIKTDEKLESNFVTRCDQTDDCKQKKNQRKTTWFDEEQVFLTHY